MARIQLHVRSDFEVNVAERAVAVLSDRWEQKPHVNHQELRTIDEKGAVNGKVTLSDFTSSHLREMTIKGDGSGRHTVTLVDPSKRQVELSDDVATRKIIDKVLELTADLPAFRLAKSLSVDGCRELLCSTLKDQALLASDSWGAEGTFGDRMLGARLNLGEPPREYLLTLKRVVTESAFDCTLLSWNATLYAIVQPCQRSIGELLRAPDTRAELLKMCELSESIAEEAYVAVAGPLQEREKAATARAAEQTQQRVDAELKKYAHLTYPLGYTRQREVSDAERDAFRSLQLQKDRMELLLGSFPGTDGQTIYFAIHAAKAETRWNPQELRISLSDGSSQFDPAHDKNASIGGPTGINPCFMVSESRALSVPRVLLEDSDWNSFIGKETHMIDMATLLKVTAEVVLYRPTKYLLQESGYGRLRS